MSIFFVFIDIFPRYVATVDIPSKSAIIPLHQVHSL